MESIKIENMLTLEETIAKDLFEGVVYPWEVLPKIGDFIKELGYLQFCKPDVHLIDVLSKTGILVN